MWRRLASGKGISPGAAEPENPEVAASLQGLIEAGLRIESADPASDIRALHWLCRDRCAFAGEVDNFRYDEEDFKELWILQFGDTESPLQWPIAESGLPAFNHWPLQDILWLTEGMGTVDLQERPEFTHDLFEEVRTWVTAARDQKRGLFVFTEG